MSPKEMSTKSKAPTKAHDECKTARGLVEMGLATADDALYVQYRERGWPIWSNYARQPHPYHPRAWRTLGDIDAAMPSIRDDIVDGDRAIIRVVRMATLIGSGHLFVYEVVRA